MKEVLSKAQRLTLIVIIADIVALGLYDIAIAYWGGGKPATISWMITWTVQQWWGSTPLLAFAYLLGHFFAQDGKVKLDGKIE